MLITFSSCSGEEGAVDGISLIVILRLWRVTRIVNGNTCLHSTSDLHEHVINNNLSICKVT